MVSCGICVKSIGNKQKLVCNDCTTEFHAACLKFSKADLDCLSADGLVWRCTNCAQKRRKSMRFDLEASEGSLTLEDIMLIVKEVRDGIKNCERGFNDSFGVIDNKLEESNKMLKEQTEKYNKMCEIVENVLKENGELKKKVKGLEDKIEEMEQYSRSNCVEIHGVPFSPSEDVVSIVKEVGKAMDMSVSDGMIDACHRLGVSRQGHTTSGIIVKFVRRLDKEEFLRRRRVKRTLSTRHIGGADDKPIYINESLSPARRRLHALARNFQRSNNFKFLWVRNGKIFLRKEENAPVKVVMRQEDLQ